MKIDLDKLSADELKTLRNDVDKALKSLDARRRAEARAAAEAAAAKFGFSLGDLGGGKKTPATKGVAKYANPADSSATWTGKGRRPDWVKAHLSKGGSLDDLAI